MFPYIVGGIAILLLFSDPIAQYFSPRVAKIPRTPRPAVNESLLAIDGVNDTAPVCGTNAYSVHILSKAPLVIYVENFVSEEERRHLLEISEPLFAPSTVTSDGLNTYQNTSIRDSAVAVVPRDNTVRCIEQRALDFQGWRDDLWIERLRTQRYVEGGHYTHHFDWGSGARGWGRVSSMMAWVAADGVEGGGTEFPLLRRRGPKEKWCQWVECPEVKNQRGDLDDGEQTELDEQVGLTFKPIAGNAVLWENFRPDGTGRGWDETWHAGMQVKKGVKVGLNIWSWGRLD
ncbi:2OG-Fe oxygenase family protein [Seiridium cupressi]|uniref:Prolyl 4-hydroxylase alpha subunit domain-containing protein n=1 Tax=Seiridium unicorne TaxID=138068 RepID=A0ABR2UI73_9PEZI